MYRLSCWRFGGSGTKVLLDPHSTSRQIQTTLRVDTNKNAVSEFSLPQLKAPYVDGCYLSTGQGT